MMRSPSAASAAELDAAASVAEQDAAVSPAPAAELEPLADMARDDRRPQQKLDAAMSPALAAET